MSEIITVRDIGTVTAEIQMIRRQVNQMVLNGAIEIGRRLVEAKELLPHGEWGKWLREEVDFSQSSAQNFIRLFEEYGDAQITLEGAVAKSQTIGNLPYTKALKLLVVPEEEREALAEEAQNLSTRELERLIRERDEAKKAAGEAEEARERLQKALEKERKEAGEAEDELDRLQEALEEAQRQAEQAEDAARPEIERMKRELSEADRKREEIRVESAQRAAEAAELQEKLRKTRDQLKALRENPKIPDSLLEQVRREEAEAAAKKAGAELEARLQAAKNAEEALSAEKAAREKELSDLRERLEAAEKKARMASPETAVFAALFQAVQEDWNKLRGALLKVDDAETGKKLRAAVQAVLEKWGKELAG